MPVTAGNIQGAEIHVLLLKCAQFEMLARKPGVYPRLMLHHELAINLEQLGRPRYAEVDGTLLAPST